jgi:hypothetical protein
MIPALARYRVGNSTLRQGDAQGIGFFMCGGEGPPTQCGTVGATQTCDELARRALFK